MCKCKCQQMDDINCTFVGDSIKKSSPTVDTVVFTFGRFQSPHVEHAGLVNFVTNYPCVNCDRYIITSASCTENWEQIVRAQPKQKRANPSKIQQQYTRFLSAPSIETLFCEGQDAHHLKNAHENPIPVNNKLYYLKKMFPKSYIVNAGMYKNNIFSCMHYMQNVAGYKKLIFIVGDDRSPEFLKSINSYNYKHVNTNNKRNAEQTVRTDGKALNVEVVGKPRVVGVSGTQMRKNALGGKKGMTKFFNNMMVDGHFIGDMTEDIALHMLRVIRQSYDHSLKLIKSSGVPAVQGVQAVQGEEHVHASHGMRGGYKLWRPEELIPMYMK